MIGLIPNIYVQNDEYRMNSFELIQLTPDDGMEGFELLQRIGRNENDITNPINGKSYNDYKQWLVEQDDWANERNLPDGYVGQTCFWLKENGQVVGFGKIRHGLTAQSRVEGGNIGWAIDPRHRGRGLGSTFLAQLIIKAKEMKVGEILLTVKKYNYPSKCAMEKCGCKVFKETEGWWYLTI